jgi:hypothetical protein
MKINCWQIKVASSQVLIRELINEITSGMLKIYYEFCDYRQNMSVLENRKGKHYKQLSVLQI